MNLQELSVGTYIYSKFSNYDKDYNTIKDINFNFSADDQFALLFDFLRKWGCRQFAKEYDTERKVEILNWYNEFGHTLPSIHESLINISDEKLRSYSTMIQGLMDRTASLRKNKNKEIPSPVRFAHVGAAKILLAIRKNVFPPWDGPIITSLKSGKKNYVFSSDGCGYCEYLVYVKSILEELKSQISDINKLPALVNRLNSSPPKIVDEYFWVTKTRKIDVGEIIKIINKPSTNNYA